jgi:hypothetical protein
MSFINEALWDRVVRVILGLGLLLAAWLAGAPAGWSVTLAVAGAVALITGLIGFCPLYALLKFRTNRA